MSLRPAASIHAVAAYLPDNIRRNDYWPRAIVSEWESRRAQSLNRPTPDTADLPPGADLVLREMGVLSRDIFNGARERRVLPDSQVASDMELAAAREVLALSGLKASQIGLLCCSTQLPDYLSVPTSSLVHHSLGLPSECASFSVEAACNGFQVQLNLAEKMIRTGAIKYALLVQSSTGTRLLRQEDAHSAWFGDGATAVILGPADKGGILGAADFTDGQFYKSLVVGCPGKRWYQADTPVYGYTEDPGAGRRMFMLLPMQAKTALTRAFEKAGVTPDQVDFFASHQGTPWLRKVSQEFVGMNRARTIDCFPWTGSLNAANIPFVLASGLKEGLLRDGDLVATFGGGGGLSYGATVLRWGV
jgi:3-oxoacyl-[acyl-carrier-protein] synthase III